MAGSLTVINMLYNCEHMGFLPQQLARQLPVMLKRFQEELLSALTVRAATCPSRAMASHQPLVQEMRRHPNYEPELQSGSEDAQVCISKLLAQLETLHQNKLRMVPACSADIDAFVTAIRGFDAEGDLED